MLDSASESAVVIYYRCAACGHVWHVPKSDPDGPPVTVAQGTKQPQK